MIPSNRKGFTFADIILILVVIAIMVVAAMSFYVLLFQQHQRITQQMTGINLAMAQVEDLMAIENYTAPELTAGGPYNATLLDARTQALLAAGYALTYSIAVEANYGGMKYKQITATATTPGPVLRTITLIGFKID